MDARIYKDRDNKWAAETIIDMSDRIKSRFEDGIEQKATLFIWSTTQRGFIRTIASIMWVTRDTRSFVIFQDFRKDMTVPNKVARSSEVAIKNVHNDAIAQRRAEIEAAAVEHYSKEEI